MKEAGGFFSALGLPAPPSLTFKPPASVAVVGSYLPRMAALPAPAVDLALEMSRDMFHEKDFRPVAEMMGLLTRDQGLRDAVLTGQRDRLARFQNQDAADRMKELLLP